MQVAIMGAGLSGLSCAIYLEKQGIAPFIFEKRSRVGDRFVNGEALFHILNRPINNCLTYIAEEFDIHLKPICEVKKLFVYSEHHRSDIAGDLGYTNLRGRHKDAFETQLAAQVKSKIDYHSNYTYEKLSKDFSHVVLATGDAAYAERMGNYRRDLTVTLKGATVEGDFITNCPSMWLNYDFAPKGYAYLLPYSKQEANIVIGYPDYPENKKKDPAWLWDKFYKQACKDTSQNLKITDQFEVSNYILGLCHQSKIGNTYFTGNNFGANMPAFGFGQFASILSGVYAAKDLCGMGDYNELTKDLRKAYENSLVLRRGLEKLDNEKLDLIVRALDSKLTDYAFDNETEIDFIKILSVILKPFE